jgi:hypothetical protein
VLGMAKLLSRIVVEFGEVGTIGYNPDKPG